MQEWGYNGIDDEEPDMETVMAAEREAEIDNDADEKARGQLAEEITSLGILDAIMIWMPERSAYLDAHRPEDYRKMAQHFDVPFDGEDFSPANDALLARYEELFEQAKDQIEREYDD